MKLQRVFDKIKYSNINLFLPPKHSCPAFDQQRIPEFWMVVILEVNLENIFQTQFLNKLEVANGTTTTALETSSLIRGHEDLSVRSDL